MRYTAAVFGSIVSKRYYRSWRGNDSGGRAGVADIEDLTGKKEKRPEDVRRRGPGLLLGPLMTSFGASWSTRRPGRHSHKDEAGPSFPHGLPRAGGSGSGSNRPSAVERLTDQDPVAAGSAWPYHQTSRITPGPTSSAVDECHKFSILGCEQLLHARMERFVRRCRGPTRYFPCLPHLLFGFAADDHPVLETIQGDCLSRRTRRHTLMSCGNPGRWEVRVQSPLSIEVVLTSVYISFASTNS